MNRYQIFFCSLLAILSLGVYLPAFAQPTLAPDWLLTRSYGGPRLDFLTQMRTTPQGEMLMVGVTNGTAQFDQYTLNNTAPTGYLMRFDSLGHLSLGQTFPASLNSSIRDVATDAAGDRYVIGMFQGNISLANYNFFNANTGRGQSDSFIAKLSSGGGVIWAQHLSGPKTLPSTVTRSVRPQSVIIDAQGDVYASGMFLDSLYIGQQIITGSRQFYCGFVLRFDAQGGLRWARVVESTRNTSINDMVAAPHHGVILAGDFLGSLTLCGQTVTHTGGTAGFTAYIDSAAALPWLRPSDQQIAGAGFMANLGVNLSNSRSATYTYGMYISPASLNGVVLPQSTNTGSGLGSDINFFVAKYDALGSVEWVQQGGSEYVFINDGTTDASGNLYTTGVFQRSLSIGSTILLSSSPDSLQGFVAKYSSSGVPLWATTTGTNTRSVSASSCAFAPSGDLYIGGGYTQDLAFGPANLLSAGSYDVFLTRMRVSAPVGLATDDLLPAASFYPNPAQATGQLRFIWPQHLPLITVSLLDSQGHFVWRHDLSVSERSRREVHLPVVPTGLYVLSTTDERGGQQHHRLVVE